MVMLLSGGILGYLGYILLFIDISKSKALPRREKDARVNLLSCFYVVWAPIYWYKYILRRN